MHLYLRACSILYMGHIDLPTGNIYTWPGVPEHLGEDQAPLIWNIFYLFANNDFCEVD